MAALPRTELTCETKQHLGWLMSYIELMDETNWRDMRLRCEQQLAELTEDVVQLTTERARLRAIIDEVISLYESKDCMEVQCALVAVIEEAAEFRKKL